MADRRDRGGLVAGLHHHAAVHEAGGVRVLDSRPADQLRARLRDRARLQGRVHCEFELWLALAALAATRLRGLARRLALEPAEHDEVLGLAAGDLGRGGREVGAVEPWALARVERELRLLEDGQKVEVLGRRLRVGELAEVGR